MHETFAFVEKLPGLYYLNEGDDLIFLVVGSQKAMLVDTGFGKVDLKAEIAKVTDKPVFLVNTHMHPDHAGGNNQFDLAYKGEKEPAEGWGVNPAKETVSVPEGHNFDLGGVTIEVIDLKGHTPGSIGLLWIEEKIILSGDAVNPQVWLHLPHSLPLSVFRDSMQHLLDMRKRWDALYFSHGEGNLIYGPEIVEGLIEAADDIISGREVGEPAETHLGHKAMLYQPFGVGFYYDPKKLTD